MSSKYDLVKVTIRTGGSGFYVLSRFVLARLLHFCEIGRDISGRIALTIKKELIIGDRLDISQHDLVEAVVAVLEREGIPRPVCSMFRTVEAFCMARIPMIVVIATPSLYARQGRRRGSRACSSSPSTSFLNAGGIINSLAARLLNCTLLQTEALLEFSEAAEEAIETLDDALETACSDAEEVLALCGGGATACAMRRLTSRQRGGRPSTFFDPSLFEDTTTDDDSDATSTESASSSCQNDEDAMSRTSSSGSLKANDSSGCRVSRGRRFFFERWMRECDCLTAIVAAHAAKARREGRALIVSGPHVSEDVLRALLTTTTDEKEDGPCVRVGVLLDDSDNEDDGDRTYPRSAKSEALDASSFSSPRAAVLAAFNALKKRADEPCRTATNVSSECASATVVPLLDARRPVPPLSHEDLRPSSSSSFSCFTTATERSPPLPPAAPAYRLIRMRMGGGRGGDVGSGTHGAEWVHREVLRQIVEIMASTGRRSE